jgi:hypothetical protein
MTCTGCCCCWKLRELPTTDLEPLAQLTVYAVQLRYEADTACLGLDRETFNRQVKELIRRMQALVVPVSEAEA